LIARWVAFWDQREPPHSLAVVRILVGLVLLWDFLGLGLSGFVPELWRSPPFGLRSLGSEDALPLLLRWVGAGPGVLEALWAVAALGALGVCLGAALRPAAFAWVLATATLARLAPDGERAIDVLLRIVLIVLACSRADAVWSLHAWLRRRRQRKLEATVPAWPRLLLFVQLLWVYFSAAQNRGGIAWWPNGEFSALARVLSDPHFARLSPGWTASVYPLTQLGTALTMTFELCAPLVVAFTYLDRRAEAGGRAGAFVRRFRLRWVWLGVGVGLHLGIAASMRLGIFPFGMLALYPLLLHPDEVQSLIRRCQRAFG
jgi:hypothetical protein